MCTDASNGTVHVTCAIKSGPSSHCQQFWASLGWQKAKRKLVGAYSTAAMLLMSLTVVLEKYKLPVSKTFLGICVVRLCRITKTLQTVPLANCPECLHKAWLFCNFQLFTMHQILPCRYPSLISPSARTWPPGWAGVFLSFIHSTPKRPSVVLQKTSTQLAGL